MIRIEDLTKEELQTIDDWKEHGVIVNKDFTYEYNNVFYEIKFNITSHSNDGCSYYFKSVCGKDINVNIRTIMKNPDYFTKIEKMT